MDVTHVAILVVCLAAAWLGKSFFDFWSTFFKNRRILRAQLPCPPASTLIRGHAAMLGPPQGFLELSNALKKYGKTITMRIFHKLVRLCPDTSRKDHQARWHRRVQP